MISDKLAGMADRCAEYAARGCAIEPETAGALAIALLDASRQVAQLEVMPFVVPDER